MGKLKYYSSDGTLLEKYLGVLDDYENSNDTHGLLKKYDLSSTHLYRILKKHKIKIRNPSEAKIKSKTRSSFFKDKTINDGYIFGFFMSDGCNHNDSYITLEIAEKDSYILYKMANIIFETNSHIPIYKNKREFWQDKFCLTIYDKNIVNKFIELGLIQRKSLTLKNVAIEHLGDDFIKGFLLGFFDGNGWLTNKKSLALGIESTLDFCTFLQKYFDKIGCDSKIYKSKSIASLRVSKKESLKKLMDYFYDPMPELFLERKFNSFKNANL